ECTDDLARTLSPALGAARLKDVTTYPVDRAARLGESADPVAKLEGNQPAIDERRENAGPGSPRYMESWHGVAVPISAANDPPRGRNRPSPSSLRARDRRRHGYASCAAQANRREICRQVTKTPDHREIARVPDRQ